MSSMDRRDFLRTGAVASAALMAAGGGLDLYADPYGIPVGLQLYTVRRQLDKDFAGTLRKVASIGYTQVQFSGFHNQPVPKIKQLIDQLGLKTAAGHFDYELFESDLSQVTDAAHTLGMSYVVLSSVPESYRHSIDGYKRAAEFFNKTGEGCRKAGLQYGYHTHNRDFEKFGSTVAFDLMLQRTDPALVCFEMDCFWVTRAGYDPVAYMNRYPGRFPVLHIKDERKHYPPTATGPTPDAAFAPVGMGIINWKRIFKAAPKGGLKYYFVEQDEAERPIFQAIKISYDYLHNLKV
ncbi:MAG TPA: sugar phosphate isomerase/epimerase [Terriglobia bacterium]|nr:sugar phosphate isomerase/epimerase [Terriglobia bacterium]